MDQKTLELESLPVHRETAPVALCSRRRLCMYSDGVSSCLLHLCLFTQNKYMERAKERLLGEQLRKASVGRLQKQRDSATGGSYDP